MGGTFFHIKDIEVLETGSLDIMIAVEMQNMVDVSEQLIPLPAFVPVNVPHTLWRM